MQGLLDGGGEGTAASDILRSKLEAVLQVRPLPSPSLEVSATWAPLR